MTPTLWTAVILALVVVVFSILFVESFHYARRIIGPRLYEIEFGSPP
ncbi:MAG: hypothetical protein ABSH34_11870 [Verrucomicrobiota bacterium]|jgi:hypothetical protein